MPAVPPDPGDPWGPEAPHHWTLYCAGICRRLPATGNAPLSIFE